MERFGKIIIVLAIFVNNNMSEYGWIMLFDRVLNMPGQRFIGF